MTSWVEYLKVGGASTTDLNAPLIEDCREPERNTNNHVHSVSQQIMWRTEQYTSHFKMQIWRQILARNVFLTTSAAARERLDKGLG